MAKHRPPRDKRPVSVTTDRSPGPDGAIGSLNMAGATCLLAWLHWRRPAWDSQATLGFPTLAPTSALTQVVVGTLLLDQVLVAGRSHDFPTFSIRDTGGWSALGDAWVLNPALGGESVAMDVAVDALTGAERDSNSIEGVARLWLALACAECQAFLAGELEEHHLNGEWALVAEPVIARMVMQMPLSNAFYLCWLAVRDVASAYLKYPRGRDGLRQLLHRSMEHKFARAQTEGWSLRSFKRHARCPQSALTAVFATVTTTLDQQYLQVIPSSRHLRDYLRTQ